MMEMIDDDEDEDHDNDDDKHEDESHCNYLQFLFGQMQMRLYWGKPGRMGQTILGELTSLPSFFGILSPILSNDLTMSFFGTSNKLVSFELCS